MHWLSIHFPPARLISRRFIAGESLDDALDVVRNLNGCGIKATLNYLGEKVDSREDARKAGDRYRKILRRIKEDGLDATISIKPTHLGLELGEDLFQENLEEVLNEARLLGNAVEVDMEDSETAGAALAVFHRLFEENKNVRIALQACLFRTAGDLKTLVEKGSSIRLVKGAYDEPAEVAWKRAREVDASYSRLIEECFTDEARASGFYPAFATHDHVLIEKALSEASKQQAPKNRFEFQMLLGVRRDWQRKLTAKGCALRVYVPFGSHWYPYFMRRLAERPANVLFLIRAMLSS